MSEKRAMEEVNRLGTLVAEQRAEIERLTLCLSESANQLAIAKQTEEGLRAGILEVAKLLGCEDEPRFKWIVMAIRERVSYAEDSKLALLGAQRVLRSWAEKYAEWSQANGHMEALFDRRLPPADHVKALEAIADALAKNPAGQPATESRSGNSPEGIAMPVANIGVNLLQDQFPQGTPPPSVTGPGVTAGETASSRVDCVENLSFEGGGRVKVDVDELLKSPRVQEQMQAVREIADPKKELK